MLLGPGRIKISGAGSSNEGLVLQAVLLMALVSTIGTLIFAARVIGSRQSSASASASQAARQAAEFGYTEIMAEMNSDENSYLWVIDSNNWNKVIAQDLETCGVATTTSGNPKQNPIPALTSNQTLPSSKVLSYKLKKYEAPTNLKKEDLLPSPPVPEVCKVKFANLIGGSGVLTIVGTFNRGSGYTSTYTLTRTVTVNRAAPIFNNPITAPPPNRIFDPADSRFPVFPTYTGPSYALTCQPQVDAASVASTSIIECTAEPSSGPPLTPLTQNFKSATAPISTPPVLDDFPFVVGQAGQAEPWTPCSKVEVVPGDERVRCLFTSIRVRANPADTTVNANMLVKTDIFPVEIFLMNDMTIFPGSKFFGYPDYAVPGDSKGWSRFRVFGVSSGTSCPSQTVTIDSFVNSALKDPKVEPNLQNAFLWLSKGRLKYQNSTVLSRIPALVGSVCEFETADGRLLPASSAAAPAFASSLSSGRFFEGLGGAYGFRGVFGGAAPIRFFYRGFGFNEQLLPS
jgi:hypothetical protein